MKTKRSNMREEELFACAYTLRSSHRRCSTKKKGFLKNFARFAGKQVSGLRAATLLKKRLQHWCFLVNFANFFRIPIVQNDSGLLLPYVT